MTSQPLQPPAPGSRVSLNAATISLILAIAVQFAFLVSQGAQVKAQVADLQSTTEPLRRGDLVAIQRDVAWIRENMARERPSGEGAR